MTWGSLCCLASRLSVLVWPRYSGYWASYSRTRCKAAMYRRPFTSRAFFSSKVIESAASRWAANSLMFCRAALGFAVTQASSKAWISPWGVRPVILFFTQWLARWSSASMRAWREITPQLLAVVKMSGSDQVPERVSMSSSTLVRDSREGDSTGSCAMIDVVMFEQMEAYRNGGAVKIENLGFLFD
ncbi:hypothetical protein B0J18DRAFT_437720 [Chaetomium sp. MPI-SDFR-AT-0129]|nr:hypothetical protein B0J18DRAFT_437720 [Chaetomium sp. MPI-SDFR-AT-0129]